MWVMFLLTEIQIELTGYALVCWNEEDIRSYNRDFEQLKGKNIEKRRFFYEVITLQKKGICLNILLQGVAYSSTIFVRILIFPVTLLVLF